MSFTAATHILQAVAEVVLKSRLWETYARRLGRGESLSERMHMCCKKWKQPSSNKEKPRTQHTIQLSGINRESRQALSKGCLMISPQNVPKTRPVSWEFSRHYIWLLYILVCFWSIPWEVPSLEKHFSRVANVEKFLNLSQSSQLSQAPFWGLQPIFVPSLNTEYAEHVIAVQTPNAMPSTQRVTDTICCVKI